MPKIIQLSAHVANLIAAGEVVERPASVIKELLENAVDAGATQITAEIRDGGMTFLRVTDNGCGMLPADAKTAFLRHATSKLRTAEDLSSIATMGFRGEALAAIASVSRIDLLTKTQDALFGTSLTLEAGTITEESEAGCPAGTTIIVRDLFFNTPARMKFMKSDTVEGGKAASAVQLQALAHPEVSFRFLRDGKEVLSTPGNGSLEDTVYSIYGRDSGRMVQTDSTWEQYRLTGFVGKPTDARSSRSMQTFFVNNRPVKSPLLTAALEEAYRNRIMTGRFPSCVLHLHLPSNTVDVNVHPAKTEVKFLNEKAVFDCVHYGVLGALNKAQDRPQMQFKTMPVSEHPHASSVKTAAQIPAKGASAPFFRTVTPEEYKTLSSVIRQAPAPKKEAAVTTASMIERSDSLPIQEAIRLPRLSEPTPPITDDEPVQQTLPMPAPAAWRLVGELYNSYILVEQGDEAFLIDKHAAHERILFDKLKSNQEAISSQSLLAPIPCRLSPDSAAILLTNRSLMAELGFEIEEFGDSTVLLRQIPMDLSAEDAADAVEAIAADLLTGRRQDRTDIRDEVLHTVACKAAIKAGWHTDEQELEALVKQVMSNEDLKYCPHGRPICITLSKQQLEKQFKRT